MVQAGGDTKEQDKRGYEALKERHTELIPVGYYPQAFYHKRGALAAARVGG